LKRLVENSDLKIETVKKLTTGREALYSWLKGSFIGCGLAPPGRTESCFRSVFER
jgi:hypothetical protein